MSETMLMDFDGDVDALDLVEVDIIMEEIGTKEIKERVKNMIKDAVKTVIRSKIKVEGVILKGDVAMKILEYSEDRDIDLIVIGATGIGDIGMFKLGNVAEKPIHYSKKPVLIAK